MKNQNILRKYTLYDINLPMLYMVYLFICFIYLFTCGNFYAYVLYIVSMNFHACKSFSTSFFERMLGDFHSRCTRIRLKFYALVAINFRVVESFEI